LRKAAHRSSNTSFSSPETLSESSSGVIDMILIVRVQNVQIADSRTADVVVIIPIASAATRDHHDNPEPRE
jgi:hypothetical protein